jgi:hypothetical protein
VILYPVWLLGCFLAEKSESLTPPALTAPLICGQECAGFKRFAASSSFFTSN